MFYCLCGLGTRVDPDELIIKPEIRPYINIDIQTIISQLDEFYDSDNDNSDLSLDDYDIYDDEAGYYDFFGMFFCLLSLTSSKLEKKIIITIIVTSFDFITVIWKESINFGQICQMS